MANMIVLGFLVGLTGIISSEALIKSVRTGVPEGTEKINLEALERGLKIAKGIDDEPG